MSRFIVDFLLRAYEIESDNSQRGYQIRASRAPSVGEIVRGTIETSDDFDAHPHHKERSSQPIREAMQFDIDKNGR
jgi:hypothetical protein